MDTVPGAELGCKRVVRDRRMSGSQKERVSRESNSAKPLPAGETGLELIVKTTPQKTRFRSVKNYQGSTRSSHTGEK